MAFHRPPAARRRRRAKSDAIDGETLLRTLLAWQRGEPRVCAMVVPPTPEQEDRRRTSRERAVLVQERVRHVNRIKGLLTSQGITDYEPLHKDRRAHRRSKGDLLVTDVGHPGVKLMPITGSPVSDCRSARSAQGTESLQTPRWRGLDSNL
jgi:transposase